MFGWAVSFFGVSLLLGMLGGADMSLGVGGMQIAFIAAAGLCVGCTVGALYQRGD